MTNTHRLGLCGLLLLAFGAPLAGCECASPNPGNDICSLPSPPAGCGMMCSATIACQPGTHCVTGRCTAECSNDHPCPNGARCSSDGTCFGGNMDGGGNRDGAVTLNDANADRTCASVSLGTQRATPNVIVIIDQSGSMSTNQFPMGSGTSRWDALEGLLMANPSGLIFSLQSSVRWGMAWFHGGDNCPQNLTTVDCALNNYDSLNTTYMGLMPGGFTPTGESIEELLTRLPSVIDDPAQPTIFILATDGDPNTCADRNAMTEGQQMSVDAVTHAFTMGIPTYVISISDDADQSRLQAVANAGNGGTGGTVYLATDTTTLATALSTIVGGVVSCNLQLMGTIDPAQACSGHVRLNGTELVCGDPNGWHAIDATNIALDGTACDMLLAGVTPLEATFPCGVVIQ